MTTDFQQPVYSPARNHFGLPQNVVFLSSINPQDNFNSFSFFIMGTCINQKIYVSAIKNLKSEKQ